MMSISDEYEIRFHLYDGNEADIEKLLDRYIKQRDEKKAEEGVMAKVIVHFYNGLISLIEGDISFFKKNYPAAFQSYQESIRLFNNFTISRTVKAILDRFVERLSHRALGQKLLTEALLISAGARRDDLFIEAMNEFNAEIQIANEMGDQMSSYAAFARASFNQSQLLYYRGKSAPANKSGEAKKNTLEARDALRQSAFIDPRYMKYLSEINDQIDILTRKRLLAKGEKFADEATKAMEAETYEAAMIGFNKASLFYKRASSLASDGSSRRKLLSFSTLYEASIKEAKGVESEKNIELGDAANFFKESVQLVEKAIALLGHYGTDTLIKSFKCQRDYYMGKHKLNLANREYDIENYEIAKQIYEESLEIFNSAIDLAVEVDNVSIKNISNDAVSEIAVYINLCETLI